MAHLNVYIPEDLKRRMDKVKDPPSWSQVACDAFERKLGELAAQKKDKVMSDVVQRLRASKLSADSNLQQAGRIDGEEWAKNSAEVPELERLEADYLRMGRDWEACFPTDDAYSGASRFVFTISPDDKGDRSAVRDFWDRYASEGVEWGEDPYIWGFAEGALALWIQVKGQI